MMELDPRLVGEGARCPTCHCWITSAANGGMWQWANRSHWTREEGGCKGMLNCSCDCAGCACHVSEESARQLLLALVT